jgi:hypothetical protein
MTSPKVPQGAAAVSPLSMADWVLACGRGNAARSALTIGSLRFGKWLRRVLRGDIRPFIRRETFVHNPT